MSTLEIPKVCGIELETISLVSQWVKKSGHSRPVQCLSWPKLSRIAGESENVYLQSSAGSRLKSDIESYELQTKTMSKALYFGERKGLSTVEFDYSLAQFPKFLDMDWFFNTLAALSDCTCHLARSQSGRL